MSRLALTTIVVALAACAACAGPPAAPARSAEAPRIVDSRHVPLLPAPDRPGGPPLSQRTVRATVAGNATILMVDTGAQAFALDTAFAEKAGVPGREAGIDGRDWGGRSIKTLRVDHPALVIDGLGPITDRPAAATSFPQGFTARGLGGVLSPQWLATDDVDVVIDFPRAQLSLRPRSSALDAKAQPHCSDRSGGIDGRVLSVDVVIEGVPAKLEIDSGADDTMVFSSAAAAAAVSRLSEVASTVPDGPGGLVMHRYAKAALKAGDLATSLDVMVVDAQHSKRCPTDGRLGMDALRRCVVVISKDASMLQCLEK